jgi:hypothetical protein
MGAMAGVSSPPSSQAESHYRPATIRGNGLIPLLDHRLNMLRLCWSERENGVGHIVSQQSDGFSDHSVH